MPAGMMTEALPFLSRVSHCPFRWGNRGLASFSPCPVPWPAASWVAPGPACAPEALTPPLCAVTCHALPSLSWPLQVREEKGDLCFFDCWNLEMSRK